MIDFSIVDPLYKLQSKQTNAHGAYDLFSSSNMKNIAKGFGDIVKPRAHKHVIRSALHLFFWLMALASKR